MGLRVQLSDKTCSRVTDVWSAIRKFQPRFEQASLPAHADSTHLPDQRLPRASVTQLAAHQLLERQLVARVIVIRALRILLRLRTLQQEDQQRVRVLANVPDQATTLVHRTLYTLHRSAQRFLLEQIRADLDGFLPLLREFRIVVTPLIGRGATRDLCEEQKGRRSRMQIAAQSICRCPCLGHAQ